MSTTGTELTTGVASPGHDEASAGPHTEVIARLATIFLLVPDSELSFDDVLRSVSAALDDDPRVVEFTRPSTLNAHHCHWRTVFPAAVNFTDPNLVSGADQRRNAEFSEPLKFRVRVPTKNQPNTSGGPIASDEYHVFWDGLTAVVGWRQPRGERIPIDGGQVVADVIRDATERAGLGAYVQACMPACVHVFAHTDIRLSADTTIQDAIFSEVGSMEVAATVYGKPTDDVGLLADLYWTVSANAALFAELKNLGRRVLDLERAARSTLLGLLRLSYQRAHVLEHPVHERPRMLWSIRGSRRESRVSLARLWVLLAAIEEVRRDWSETRLEFERGVGERGQEVLFRSDATDFDLIAAVDTGLIQSAMHETAGRLDTSRLVLATFSSGSAAIVGVLVGYFL